MTKPGNSTAQLLRSSLRDARSRELAITRFIAWVFVFCAVMSVLLFPLIGWKLSLLLAVVLGVGALGYRAQSKAMAGGFFSPALQWINVTVEVSTPSALFVADMITQGPVYALTSPPLAFWGAVIMLSGLRARRSLAIYAGVLAAAQYAALYLLMAYPVLPADAPVTLQPALIGVRCVLLVLCGVLTAVVTSQFIAHAEAAFSQVREKELSGKYMLHERIGSGGMAEVFRATYSPEGGFEKLVAVKRVLPAYTEDDNFVQLFRREAEVCSRLSHPNIVQVFDLGRDRGTYFLAMEFIDGISLQALIRASVDLPLPLPAITFIAAELASALDYLHQRMGPDGKPLRLVHRDVNPPNVLLSKAGEVKLSDFGIARAADSVALTEGGLVRGKAGYMPPEQIYNEVLDGRADLFALGVTLYEALTTRRCYVGENTEAVLKASLNVELPPPSKARRDVPPELDAIIMELVDKDRARRVASGAALRERLLALTGPAAPLPHGPALLGQALKLASERISPPVRSLADAVTAESREQPNTKAPGRRR